MSDIELPPPGTPFQHMSRTERIQRKDVMRQAREEMRNAARLALTEQGFTKDALKAQIKDLATDAVREYFKGHNMQGVLRATVQQEMERQLGGSGEALKALVKNVITEEARKAAAEFIKNNMTVTVKDTWG